MIHQDRRRVDDGLGGRLPERGPRPAASRRAAPSPSYTAAAVGHVAAAPEPLGIDGRDGVEEVAVQLQLPVTAALVTAVAGFCNTTLA